MNTGMTQFDPDRDSYPPPSDRGEHAPMREVRLKPACAALRHKLMYVDERQARPGLVDTDSTTRVFLCAKTGDGLGPDDRAVEPGACCDGRGCYQRPVGVGLPGDEGVPVDLTTPRGPVA